MAKFVGLCANANPNALEILFADPRDWMFETPAWRRLYDQRHQFLTKKVQQTFLGYALAQLNRIRTHRAWLLQPPKAKPTREAFGLSPSTGTISSDDQNRIEAGLAEKLRSYRVDGVEMPKATRIAVEERMTAFYCDVLATSPDALDALGIPTEVMSTLNAEKRYQAAMKHWESYQTWARQRNPARADLERAHGYDTKHAMHLIRLMRMGLEVLEAGELRVRRADAEELSAIRDGALPYDALLAAAEALQQQMREAVGRSGLPADVDREAVDRLVLGGVLGWPAGAPDRAG